MKFILAVALCLIASQTARSMPYNLGPLIPGPIHRGPRNSEAELKSPLIPETVPHGPLSPELGAHASPSIAYSASSVLVEPLNNEPAARHADEPTSLDKAKELSVSKIEEIHSVTEDKVIETPKSALGNSGRLEKQASSAASDSVASAIESQVKEEIPCLNVKSVFAKSDASDSGLTPSSESEESSEAKAKVVKEIVFSKEEVIAESSAGQSEGSSADSANLSSKDSESSIVKTVITRSSESAGQADGSSIDLASSLPEKSESSKIEEASPRSDTIQLVKATVDLAHSHSEKRESPKIEEAILSSEPVLSEGAIADSVHAYSEKSDSSKIEEAISRSGATQSEEAVADLVHTQSEKSEPLKIEKSAQLEGDIADLAHSQHSEKRETSGTEEAVSRSGAAKLDSDIADVAHSHSEHSSKEKEVSGKASLNLPEIDDSNSQSTSASSKSSESDGSDLSHVEKDEPSMKEEAVVKVLSSRKEEGAAKSAIELEGSQSESAVSQVHQHEAVVAENVEKSAVAEKTLKIHDSTDDRVTRDLEKAAHSVEKAGEQAEEHLTKAATAGYEQIEALANLAKSTLDVKVAGAVALPADRADETEKKVKEDSHSAKTIVEPLNIPSVKSDIESEPKSEIKNEFKIEAVTTEEAKAEELPKPQESKSASSSSDSSSD